MQIARAAMPDPRSKSSLSRIQDPNTKHLSRTIAGGYHDPRSHPSWLQMILLILPMRKQKVMKPGPHG